MTAATEGLGWGSDIRVLPFGDRAWMVEPVGPVPQGWAVELAARAEAAWPRCQLIPGLASLLIARSVTWDGVADQLAGPVHGAAQWPRTADEVRSGLAPGSTTRDQRGDPHATTGSRLPTGNEGGWATAAMAAEALERARRTHVLPARYDGPDLAAAADQVGLTQSELVARHVAAEWTVAAVGFSPGFGYLICGDPVFAAIARHSDPRSRVPAGAIALAAGMCAVYPSATPGGWQLVGTTDAVLWDPTAVPPAQLRVGDRVRFEAA